MAKKTLTFISMILKQKQERQIQAVLLIRDLDTHGQEKRRFKSLQDSRINHKSIDSDLQVVIGAAKSKREAWVLNGFIPQTTEEEKKLSEIKKKLKFDPCLEAHRLRGDKKYPEQRDRDAKVVLAQLTEEKFEREQQCWTQTELELLRDRGQATGLTDYLHEIETSLLPMIAQSP
ncbi:MAG: hypothetical protein F6J87_28935 [Spirulina sp. SIO3F2]|nr:hypothetical protein [Spirulina sp. SIO3F2]